MPPAIRYGRAPCKIVPVIRFVCCTNSAALPLIDQMASALDAAHEAGVIHRDFKPSNVMLVPATGGERAIVTAGVARMPLGRFSVLTFVGSLLWCTLLVAIGDFAGKNWDTWHRRFGYLDYVVVAAAIAAVVWLVLRQRRQAAH